MWNTFWGSLRIFMHFFQISIRSCENSDKKNWLYKGLSPCCALFVWELSLNKLEYNFLALEIFATYFFSFLFEFCLLKGKYSLQIREFMFGLISPQKRIQNMSIQLPKYWVLSLGHLDVFAVLVTGLVILLVTYIVILLCKSI